MTPAVRAMAVERIPNLVISDSAGSSETGAQMHVTSMDDVEVGSFLPGPGTLVVDETLSRVLPPGHEGNGWLAQTGNVPLGYLGDPEKTARTFPVIDGVRYSIPGDRARHRADGQIELLGRDSVTVNSGGEKIFVEEVERAIAGHPAVADVVVVGRPSERWGQEVVAVIQLSEGATASSASVVEEASAHIARYKLPKDVVFVDVIQRSPSGKADYRWAAETAVKASTAPQGLGPSRRPSGSADRGQRVVTARLVLRPFTDVDRAPFYELNTHPLGGRVAGLVAHPGRERRHGGRYSDQEMEPGGLGVLGGRGRRRRPLRRHGRPAPGARRAAVRAGGRGGLAAPPGPVGSRLRHRGGGGVAGLRLRPGRAWTRSSPSRRR